MRRLAIACVLGSVLAIATIGEDMLRDAIVLGHKHDDAVFESFDKGYALTAYGSIDSAEVMTEFRRAVILVRERDALGDHIDDTHTLSSMLAPFAGLVTFIVQARLNPLNTYKQPPNYYLYVRTGDKSNWLSGKSIIVDAVYSDTASQAGEMVGIRLTSSFRRADIEAATQPQLVLIDDHANPLWQMGIDLRRYR